MSALKLTIPGSYWDSYVYSGRLYLFGCDGSIRSINWDRLTEGFKLQEDLRIALRCAFQRSDYLYSSDVQSLLYDPEIKSVVQAKFDRLSRRTLDVSEATLRRFEDGHQDNPCPFPHADLEIYNKNLYVGSARGLVRASCNKQTRYPISTRPEKKWDGPSFGLAASYGALAVAAGTEGLWEVPAAPGYSASEEYKQLSANSCRDCNWSYFSIFASTDESGFFAEFTKIQNGAYVQTAQRRFERIETAVQIFGSQGYAWGVQDKLCQAGPNSIKVMRYTPWELEESDRLKSLGTIRFQRWKGAIVSASTASFGVIVELENAIVVLPSLGPAVTLPGEVVNWRVFPRSRNYENQLHVVHDDRLEILSFNHDYLVNQEEKVLGTRFVGARRLGRRPAVSQGG